MGVQYKIDSLDTGSNQAQSHSYILKRMRSKGFTIIELVISIMIISILTTIAVPTMRDWYISNSVRSQTEEIVSLFDQARSYAMENSRVAFLSGTQDEGGLASSDTWNNEIVVYNSQNEELAVLELKNQVEVKLKATSAQRVVFLPNGMSGYSSEFASRFINPDDNDVVLLVCGQNSDVVYVGEIHVGVVGSTTITYTERASCEPEPAADED